MRPKAGHHTQLSGGKVQPNCHVRRGGKQDYSFMRGPRGTRTNPNLNSKSPALSSKPRKREASGTPTLQRAPKAILEQEAIGDHTPDGATVDDANSGAWLSIGPSVFSPESNNSVTRRDPAVRMIKNSWTCRAQDQLRGRAFKSPSGVRVSCSPTTKMPWSLCEASRRVTLPAEASSTPRLGSTGRGRKCCNTGRGGTYPEPPM